MRIFEPGDREVIGVGGSATDPLTDGHMDLLRLLRGCGRYSQIVWIPSGIRDGKQLAASPDHRVGMIVAAVSKKWILDPACPLHISFEDVYGENTPSIRWLERLQREHPNALVEWYTGSDSVVPRPEYGGKCEIIAKWVEGERLAEEWPFLIIERPSYPLHDVPMPLKRATVIHNRDIRKVLGYNLPDTASSFIKRDIEFHGDIHGVPEEVATYIRLNHLYGYRD